MKKSALFIVCMLLFFMAGNEVSAKKPRVAVGKNPVIECEDLKEIFSYPGTEITEAELVDEGSIEIPDIGYMPEHCIVKGKMNERTSPVDGKTYAIGFEMRLPAGWKGRFFY